MPFELLRQDTQGNFYSSMIKSLGEMVGPPNVRKPQESNQNDSPEKKQNDPPKQSEEPIKEKPESAEPTTDDSQKKD